MGTLRRNLISALMGALLAFVGSDRGAAEQPSVSVVLTGQSLLQSDFRIDNPDAVAAIRPLLKGDVVFTDFETTVKKPGDSLADLDPIGGVYGPPGAIDALKSLGFNLLALSNNHSYDIGAIGILNTLDSVEAAGLAHAGAGRNLAEANAPGYLQAGRARVALVSMASGLIRPGAFAGSDHPGLNEIHLVGGTPGVDAGSPSAEDSARILGSIRAAARRADLVIAYQHNHVYDKDFVKMMAARMPERLVPPPWIRRWAHQEVDAGADIVVLHGAPLVQGVEIYHGRPIFYDLGNFIFQLPLRIDATNLFESNVWESVVARANFDGKTLKSVTFVPIILDKEGRGQGELKVATRGLPAQAHGAKAREILQRLIDASRPMGSEIVMHGDVAELNIGEAASSH